MGWPSEQSNPTVSPPVPRCPGSRQGPNTQSQHYFALRIHSASTASLCYGFCSSSSNFWFETTMRSAPK